jgi:hypothetical protein
MENGHMDTIGLSHGVVCTKSTDLVPPRLTHQAQDDDQYVIVTREHTDRMGADCWMALNEWPSEWDPVRDIVVFRIPEVELILIALKWPDWADSEDW